MDHTYQLILLSSVILAIFLGAYFTLRLRPSDLKKECHRLGLHFDAFNKEINPEILLRFSLFHHGEGFPISGVVHAHESEKEVYLLDYVYWIPSKTTPHLPRYFRQTVLAFHSKKLQFPWFEIHPRKVGIRWNRKKPVFSSLFKLKTEAGQFFGSPFVINFFKKSFHRYSVEGHEDWVLVYRRGQTFRGHRLKQFISEARKIHDNLEGNLDFEPVTHFSSVLNPSS